MTALVSFVPLVEIDLSDRFRAARMSGQGRARSNALPAPTAALRATPAVRASVTNVR